MVVATKSSAQIVQRYDDGRSDPGAAPDSDDSASAIRGALLTRDSLPQPVQVHRAKSTIVEAVARLTGFAPDHPPVVGTDRPVEARLVQRGQDCAHVDITMIGWMRGLLERAHSGTSDVAAMNKMDSLTSADALNDFDQVVPRIGCERAGAEGDAVRWIVNDVDDALQRATADDDAWQSKDRPRWIVGMQRQTYARFRRNGNYSLQKMGEIFPEPLFVDSTIRIDQCAKIGRRIRCRPAWQIGAAAGEINLR